MAKARKEGNKKKSRKSIKKHLRLIENNVLMLNKFYSLLKSEY